MGKQRCNKMGPNPGDRCLENCLELKYYENDPALVDKQAVDPTKDNPIMIINAPAAKQLDCNDGVIGCKDGYNNNIKNNNNKNNNNKNNNNKNNKNNNNVNHPQAIENMEKKDNADAHHSPTMENMEKKEKKEKMEKSDYWRSGGEPWPVRNYEYKATHKAKDEEPQE